MKKAIFNKSGMKMIIDSGYKTFDKETNLITTGNVWANTQQSGYIRPYDEVINGGYVGKPGDFLKYDLQFFKQVHPKILAILNDRSRVKSMILYQFSANGKVIGHILADYDDNFIRMDIATWSRVNFNKAYACLNCCKEYVCN